MRPYPGRQLLYADAGLHRVSATPLEQGTEVVAGVDASDPDADSLDFEWLVMRESTATSTGGDPEAVPEGRCRARDS